MATDSSSLRVLCLVEDPEQDRFLRQLLLRLGFSRKRIRIERAPDKGAAEAWIRKRYPGEVKVLRSKNFQTGLCLLAMPDGDRFGVARRKQQLEDELRTAGYAPRAAGERIATPVPTWNIETWLLFLLGDRSIDESRSYKTDFPPKGVSEREAYEVAAAKWPSDVGAAAPPSLLDAIKEISRLTA